MQPLCCLEQADLLPAVVFIVTPQCGKQRGKCVLRCTVQLALFSRLCNEVLARRAAKRYEEESLALASALLEQNPEVYTAWNFRREALQQALEVELAFCWTPSRPTRSCTTSRHRAPLLQEEPGPGEAQRLAERELDLTEKAVRKNPKSYAAWHHRRWVVEQGLCPVDKELDLVDRCPLAQEDIALCLQSGMQARLLKEAVWQDLRVHGRVARLLDLDERNFHGWGYRQFVVHRAGVPPAAEEAYTAARIGQNFSNYSAWHARTALLQRLHASSRTVTLDQLLAEDAATPAGAIRPSQWAPSFHAGVASLAHLVLPAGL